MKKLIAINAGPRPNYNTAKLVQAVCDGAKAQGIEVEYISLYKLDVKGCYSCFRCKKVETYGKCVIKDDVGEILEKIRNADGLVIGSPNYLGNLTAAFRAVYERLVFQSLTYNKEKPCCNDHPIPVLLVHTSNCNEEAYEMVGYKKMLEGYQGTLNNFVGPTQVFSCGNTLQVDDYSQYNWTMFDPKQKKAHHDETFDAYLQKAYKLGKELIR